MCVIEEIPIQVNWLRIRYKLHVRTLNRVISLVAILYFAGSS